MFPEGTINHSAPVMGRFKNGPFRLAIEKQVPIVPITFLNIWKLLPDDFKTNVGHPGIARIVFHAPVEAREVATREELIARVRAAIASALPEEDAHRRDVEGAED